MSQVQRIKIQTFEGPVGFLHAVVKYDEDDNLIDKYDCRSVEEALKIVKKFLSDFESQPYRHDP